MEVARRECARFPALGPAFYDSGPATARARLVAYLREAVARGELAVTDLDLAADQSHAIAKAGLAERIVFDPGAQITAVDRERSVNGAVDTFMGQYGAA